MGTLIRTSIIRLILVAGLAGGLWSQVVGAALSGAVKDDTGGALPGATVSVRNLETGAERKLRTDSSGRYSAPSIAAGKYEVSAEKEGFNSQVKTGTELAV